MKVEIAPGALDAFPEDQREEMEQSLRDMFADFDPEDATPVLSIEPGTTECPKCGSALKEPHGARFPDGPVLIYDCSSADCDGTFIHETN